MRIERKTDGDVTVLALCGDLDIVTLPAANEVVDEVLETGVTKLVFNLSALKFTHSSGLGFMIKTHQRLRADGGKLVFSEPSDFFRSMVTSVGLDKVFEAFESDADAVAHFGAE